MNGAPRLGALLVALAATSCGKVDIVDVYAGFELADATWFEEEETLFVFYDVSAEQGIGEPSVIELRYRTDTEVIDWTPIDDFPTVHRHEAIDCGSKALCGSTSIHVPDAPRAVEVRLRYHRDGELALAPYTVFNIVGLGDAHSNRSFLVYGTFDETNTLVQWRGRHLFPTLRNEQVEELGLRRAFLVDDQRTGTAELADADNLYGYGVDCPSDFTATDLDPVETDERAVFNTATLPITASADSTVCAESTVTDAKGTFTTAAIARKNPEVRPAFPVLRSPIREATPIPFFLGPCERVISEEHEAMQRQRLQLGDLATTCIDDWDSPDFVDRMIVLMTDAVEAERAAGNDMVLVIALHQDEAGVSAAIEEVLAAIVPEERHRSSPRLVGAFVLDSDIRGLTDDALDPVTLWCPSRGGSSASGLSCAIAPDIPGIELGPFSFGLLPILPSRSLYLDFIDTYSEAQAGQVLSQSFLTPEFAANSDHVDLGDYGNVTFLNDEIISAGDDDAFSYCTQDTPDLVVFRTEFLGSDKVAALLEKECAAGNLDEEFCGYATLGLLPLLYLPQWHDWTRESTYELGVYWDFPFLLRMEYEAVTAGAISAFGLSVPFGLSFNGEQYLGSVIWTADEIDMADVLTQCDRFCDHPTFDSAGVYQVSNPFRSTYMNSCYVPDFPVAGDGGFPSDP
jgi:hypothetical protein